MFECVACTLCGIAVRDSGVGGGGGGRGERGERQTFPVRSRLVEQSGARPSWNTAASEHSMWNRLTGDYIIMTSLLRH